MCVVTSQSLFDLAVWVGFEREHGFGSYLVIRHIYSHIYCMGKWDIHRTKFILFLFRFERRYLNKF